MQYLRKSEINLKMNKVAVFLLFYISITGCGNRTNQTQRVPVAKVGSLILYYDQIPRLIQSGLSPTDSIAIIQNYVNNWAKKQLVYLKAIDNLSPDFKNEIEAQLQETRVNLVIYQYQRQMMLEKMDTTITEEELKNYYSTNEKNFKLNSNIVKALFVKVPKETPNIDRIRIWSRSNEQKDLQELEKNCYQFAEKFDDFNEDWVTMDRLSVELPQDILNQDDFLRYNKWYETRDSSSVYLLTIRDFRLRYSLAPYEYVRNDIKSIILNNRRFGFLQSLENGIYNEAIKGDVFKIY
jgi:hypothetical protein